MNTSFVRSFVLAVLGAVVVAGSLAAQNPPSGALSAAQVTQLISRGEPADHARLSAHFTALADQQAADAKRHMAMQQAYADSKKAPAVNMVGHCKLLASRSQESAASLRELAAYHSNLAGGAAVEAPRAAAGGGAPSDAELTRLAAGATTAADHRTLETYFTTLAARYDREAADHAAYAKKWRGLSRVPAAATQAATHDRVATQRRESAAEARAAATMHKDQAATVK